MLLDSNYAQYYARLIGAAVHVSPDSQEEGVAGEELQFLSILHQLQEVSHTLNTL